MRRPLLRRRRNAAPAFAPVASRNWRRRPAPSRALALAAGRLAGNGYSVAIGGADWFRTLTIASPSRILQSGPDGRRALGTRGIAMVAAALFIFIAFFVAVSAAANGPGRRSWCNCRCSP